EDYRGDESGLQAALVQLNDPVDGLLVHPLFEASAQGSLLAADTEVAVRGSNSGEGTGSGLGFEGKIQAPTPSGASGADVSLHGDARLFGDADIDLWANVDWELHPPSQDFAFPVRRAPDSPYDGFASAALHLESVNPDRGRLNCGPLSQALLHIHRTGEAVVGLSDAEEGFWPPQLRTREYHEQVLGGKFEPTSGKDLVDVLDSHFQARGDHGIVWVAEKGSKDGHYVFAANEIGLGGVAYDGQYGNAGFGPYSAREVTADSFDIAVLRFNRNGEPYAPLESPRGGSDR